MTFVFSPLVLVGIALVVAWFVDKNVGNDR
jgi:hypothetical protein